MAQISVFRRGIAFALSGTALVAGLAAVEPLHAASLPHYDLDSLIFMSSDVVEGRLMGSIRPLDPARGGRGAADSIEVEAVYKGGFAPGDRVRLTGLGHYAKSRSRQDEEGTELLDGDRVFLFLNKPRNSDRTRRNAAGDSEQLTSFEPVWSGVKLIENGTVVEFLQWPSDFAPYTAVVRGAGRPTTEEFEELLRMRVEQIRSVESRFQQPVSPADTTWLLDLLRERRKPRPTTPPDFASLLQQDGIAEHARARLAELENPSALDEALQISGFGSYTLSRGFGTPAGLDFVLQKVQASEIPLAKRVLYAKVLTEAVSTYYSRLSVQKPAESLQNRDAAEGEYLTQIAKLARQNAANESLCVVLVECLSRRARSQRQQAQFSREWNQVVEALAGLYEGTTSERIRFQVELTLAHYQQATREHWTAMSGPIISIVEPAHDMGARWGGSTGFDAEPRNPRRIGFRYHVMRRGPVDVRSADVVAKHVGKAQTYTLGHLDGHRSGELAGGGSYLLPEDAPSGKYRVYPRFFDSHRRIISVGYGFEVEVQ